MFFCPLCRYNRIAREWTQKYAMWCLLDTFIHCLFSCFGHCCKTIFLHLSLMEGQSQFSAQTGMQACSWPLHTTQSSNGQIHQSDGCSSTLSSAYLWSLSINSSHSTTPHACLTRVCSLWAARRENVCRLFCFFGALLLECMQMQEKRHSDQLLAQKGQSRDTEKQLNRLA